MPDTGERREITKHVNAKEEQTTQQSKKVVSIIREKTAEADVKNDAKNKVRQEDAGKR